MRRRNHGYPAHVLCRSQTVCSYNVYLQASITEFFRNDDQCKWHFCFAISYEINYHLGFTSSLSLTLWDSFRTCFWLRQSLVFIHTSSRVFWHSFDVFCRIRFTRLEQIFNHFVHSVTVSCPSVVSCEPQWRIAAQNSISNTNTSQPLESFMAFLWWRPHISNGENLRTRVWG